MNTTGPINYAPPVTEDQRGRINKYPVCQTQEGNAGRVDGHQAPTTEPIAQLGLILVRTRCTIDATTVETVEVEIGLSVPTDPAIENDATVVFSKAASATYMHAHLSRVPILCVPQPKTK